MMALKAWNPPAREEPSRQRRGEISTDRIYLAVGRAMSRWEHAESALIKLFQLLCESESLAVCRAYGSIVSAAGRSEALLAASLEFYARRELLPPIELTSLIKAFGVAGGFRNKIAHGIVTGCDAPDGEHLGYYLMPPSYTTRHRATPRPAERWWLSAKYFYVVSDIESCSSRFEELLMEAMRLLIDMNDRYKMVPYGELHP
jgi:hypothetical protein